MSSSHEQRSVDHVDLSICPSHRRSPVSRDNQRAQTRNPRRGSGVHYLLLFALVLSPLPFGAVYQWTWAGLSLIVGVLLLVSVFSNQRGDAAIPDHIRALWLPALLYMTIILWLAVQASGLTPASWGHAVWRQARDALGHPISVPISLDPYDTWSELVKMLANGGVFWLAVLYGRDASRTRASLWVLAIAGSFYAIYGLAAHFTDFGESLWRHEMPLAGVGVSSTFVNRTMYVDYAAFGFLAVLALVLETWWSRRASNGTGLARWQGLLSGEHSHLLLLLMMSSVILAALTLTGSRGGVFAAASASTALLFLGAGRRGSKPRRRHGNLLIGLIFLGIWLLVYLVAGAPLGSRLADAAPGVWSGRLDGYRIILRAIAEAPLTGYGAGSSYDVYYLFNDGTLWRALNYAHNIYLGAAVELGIPAAIGLVAAVGLVVVHCLMGIRRRRRHHAFAALGVGVGLHVALHGLVDSPLYLAANAATFSFLLGLAYAQSWPSHRH